MKTNNIKKKSLVGLLTAFIAKTWATLLVYIGVIALLVGGYMVWQVWRFCDEHLPTTPPGNTNTIVFLKTDTDASYEVIYNNTPSNSANSFNVNSSIVDEPLAMNSNPDDIVIQYILTSTNPTGRLSIGNSNILLWNDTLNTLNGTNDGGYSTVIYSPCQKLKFNFSYTWNPDTFMFSQRYYVDVLDFNTNTYNVVLEYSSDLQSWVPMFTNRTCNLYTLHSYTNSSSFTKSFYRLKISNVPNR